ncbi:MAG: quinone-dependent dihydroorotate dehydrogenase, partial [Bacteroidota bacterium]
MYSIIRKFLFLFDAEKVHYFSTNALGFILKLPFFKIIFKNIFCFEDPKLERNIFGLKFKNPVGLAAGFDKNATMFQDLEYLGFGFIEVGTVTPKPQEGNEKPRLFRLKKDEAILNRMGFNNDGLESMKLRLKNRKKNGLIIGGNIGKNKITPNEEAINDYISAFNELFDFVDYFVVNVSSPNTPNLRALQEKEPLTKILAELQLHNNQKKHQKPILLKIAPDLTNEQLDDIIDIVDETKIAGIIATNTTINRTELKTDEKIVESLGAGGVSGKPLTKRSTEVIRYLHEKSNGTFPIIGVGGIHSPEDAVEKLKAGASLIQLY